jgi:hypothetical protein
VLIEGKAGHGPDLHPGTPEDSISHLDAVDLRQGDFVSQLELTVTDLAVLYPEVLPVPTEGHDAALVLTLHGEGDFHSANSRLLGHSP